MTVDELVNAFGLRLSARTTIADWEQQMMCDWLRTAAGEVLAAERERAASVCDARSRWQERESKNSDEWRDACSHAADQLDAAAAAIRNGDAE